MKDICKRGHNLNYTAYVRKDGKGRFCTECVKIRKAERAEAKIFRTRREPVAVEEA